MLSLIIMNTQNFHTIQCLNTTNYFPDTGLKIGNTKINKTLLINKTQPIGENNYMLDNMVLESCVPRKLGEETGYLIHIVMRVGEGRFFRKD